MNKLLTFLVAVVLSFGTFASFASENKDAPVMIIRFNQELVAYQKSLQKVVTSAMEVKPNVLFDVVSVVPAGSNNKVSKKTQEAADFTTKQVLETLQAKGVKLENIRTTFQNSTIVQDGEVHIFLR
jgi:hypothetical protein